MKARSANNGELPESGQYVLGLVNGRPWVSNTDNVGNRFFKVVMFIKGRKNEDITDGIYRSEDEHGNNQKPYYWKEFGTGSYFGQEIDLWFDLNEITGIIPSEMQRTNK